MDEHLVSPKESYFHIKKNKPPNPELDLLDTNHPTWSTRYKCFLVFYCLVLCYTNIMRFCITMGKYKIIIIIPYLILNIFVGVPALLVEVMLGRFVMGNVSSAWNMCPPARGIFWCSFVATGYLIVLNYLVINFLLNYFFSTVGGHLKWESCDGSWAQINCYEIGKKSDAIAQCIKVNSEKFCHNLTWESSGTQFWKYSFANNDEVAEVCLSVLFMFLSVSGIALILCKKIRSLEKVQGMLVYPALVLWFIFLFVSFSAANALHGFKKLCFFNWSDIIEPKIWAAALEDTICLLGLGKLTLSFISSHGKFTDNIVFDILVVIFGSLSTCLLLGFPILNIIAGNRNIDERETDGPLFRDITEIFISVSEALLFYPYPKTLWAAIYYLGCILISLSSQAVLVLSFCESLEGVLNITKSEKPYAIIITCVSVVFFLLGISSIFLQCVKDLNQATVVVVITLLCTITWQTFYGIQKFNYDYHFMMGYPPPTFIKITWITLPSMVIDIFQWPFAFLLWYLLDLTFIMFLRHHLKLNGGLTIKIYFKIPNVPVQWIVLIYTSVIVLIYLIVILYKIVSFSLQKEKISKVFMANPNWGPDNPLLKRSRAVFDASTVNKEFMYRQELYKKPFLKPPDFSKQNIVQLI